MSNFLKENWIWIVSPVLTVALIVFLILVYSKDDPEAAAFTYTLR